VTDLKSQVKTIMKTVRKEGIPASEVVVAEALSELGLKSEDLTPDTVRQNFNSYLRAAFTTTLEVLERYEKQAYGQLMIEKLLELKHEDIEEASTRLYDNSSPEKRLQQEMTFLFDRWYEHLRQMFLSISQSRKARGGKDFELQIGALLDLIEVPFQKKKRTHRVDFMIPSDQAFEKNRSRALIISAKRTLRERWREVVEELYSMRAPNVYLATADEDVSESHVKAVCRDYNIHLVVWDELKARTYTDENLVISYSVLANEIIPVFKQFWGLSEG
jgi:hypothetical protein